MPIVIYWINRFGSKQAGKIHRKYLKANEANVFNILFRKTPDKPQVAIHNVTTSLKFSLFFLSSSTS